MDPRAPIPLRPRLPGVGPPPLTPGITPALPPNGPPPGGMGMPMGPPPEMGPPPTLPPPPPPPVDPFAKKYPSWLYKTNRETGERELDPPSMPEPGQFRDWIAADALLYGELLRRFDQDLRAYPQLVTGVQREFDPDVDTAFISSEATVQVNKVAAMVGGSPVSVRYPWRTTDERDAARRMEQFALWLITQWKSQHRIGGNSELQWDMAWYALVYGRVVVGLGCDLEDGDFPWWLELLDPATCFPVWGKGKRGLLRMSRRYTASLGDILSEFDPLGEHRLLRKLTSKDGGTADRDDVDLTEDRLVEECWTAWHRFVEVDGVEIERVAHEYGIVPFVYNLCPGEAGSIAAPGRMGDTGLSPTDITRRGYGAPSASSRQRDLAQKGQSFYHAIRHMLRQREKTLALSMISLEQTTNPALVVTSPYPTPPAPMDLAPGKRNTLRQGEISEPAVPAPRPFDAQLLLGEINTELRKGLLPDVIFGQTEGSNITGFASDSLMAAAKDRIDPYFQTVSTTYADTIAMAGLLFYNHGHLAEGLPSGTLIVPRSSRGGPDGTGSKAAAPPPWAKDIIQKMVMTIKAPAPPPPALTGGLGNPQMTGGQFVGVPGFVDPSWTLPDVPPSDDPEVRIDRETIDLVGFRPEQVSLETLGLNNRTVLINYLTQAVQAKLMPRAIAMDQLPEITDVWGALQQIVAEDAMTDPQMLHLVGYPRALAEQGDSEGWWLYWAAVLLPEILGQLQALMNPMGSPPGGGPPSGPSPGGTPGGSPGGPPPNGGGQSPIPQPPGPATNPAMAGQGPGSQGAPVGRPGMS